MGKSKFIAGVMIIICFLFLSININANTSENQDIIVFSDDFPAQFGPSPLWTTLTGSVPGNCSWVVGSEGTYNSSQTGTDQLCLQSVLVDWEDYSYEVDIRGNAGVDKEITFRVQDGLNTYSLNLVGDPINAIQMNKVVNGSSTNLVNQSFMSVADTWYHVKVECSGATFTVSVNSNQIFQYTDNNSPFLTGGIGLVNWTGSTGICDISFDNVIVSASYLDDVVIPTYVWRDFYCSVNTLNGSPIPVGTVITARDPDGVKCGEFVVSTAGSYGFMPVYGDDNYTTIDEGANVGDVITFYINGMLANTNTTPVWTSAYSQTEVCLEVGSSNQNIAFSVVTIPQNTSTIPGSTVTFGVEVRNDGDGTDYYSVNAESDTSPSPNWTTVNQSSPSQALPGQTVWVYFEVLISAFPSDTVLNVPYTVYSALDNSVNYSNSVTIYVTLTAIESDTIKVGTVTGYEGSTARVDIDYSNICDLWDADFSFSWDGNYLTVTHHDIYPGFNSSENVSIVSNSNSHLEFTSTWPTTPLSPGSGNILTFTYYIASNTPVGFYPIDMYVLPRFTRDCGSGQEDIQPVFMSGGIVVDYSPTNEPPILNPIGNQSVTAGEHLNFSVSAWDHDLLTLTLSTSELPAGATFTDNGSGSGTFDWTPQLSQAGSYDITFTVSDGQFTDEEIITITVSASTLNPPLFLLPGIMGTHIYQHDGYHNAINCANNPEDCEIWYSADDAVVLGENYFNNLFFTDDGLSPEHPEFKTGNNIGEGKVFGEMSSDRDPIIEKAKNIYWDLISSIENQSGYIRDVNFFVFPYDWRYDNRKTYADFRDFVISKTGNLQSVDVIAHSMGGLVVRQFANNYPSKINKVIFIGTPHHGSVEMLTALFGQKKIGHYIGVLSGSKVQEMARNYPSAYQLLPDDYYQSCIPEGYTYFMDECKTLSQNCLSKTTGDILNYPEIDRYNFLQTKIIDYRNELTNSIESIPNPYIIAGSGYPTPAILYRWKKYHYFWDYDFKYMNGDSTVTLFSAKDGLEHNGNLEIFYRNQKHSKLPNDSYVINLITAILNDQDYSSITGIQYSQPSYAFISGTTASPVTVEITDDQGRRNYYDFENDIEIVEIPNSYFRRFDENETFAYDANCNCEVTIKGTDEGSFSLLISHTSNDSTISEMAFFDIPVNDSSIGIIAVDSTEVPFKIEYDFNNSGEIDTLIPIPPEEYVCCKNNRGNANNDYNDLVDISDLLYLVDYAFVPGSPEPACQEEADVDGSGAIDVSDLLYLVDYMFLVPPGPAPVPCP